MGFWNNPAITGEGADLLDAGATNFVSGYETQIVSLTNPRVRQRGLEPTAYQYAGIVGFSQNTIAAQIVLFDKHLNWEHEFIVITAAMYCYASVVFWKLPPGITWSLSVYW